MNSRVTIAVAILGAAAAGSDETRTILTLDLYTGGKIMGWVVDHNDHGVVLVHNRTPYVVAWKEITPDCAVGSRFKIVAAERGGPDGVTAGDYFQLGLYALERNRNAKAAGLFRSAKRLDPELTDEVQRALADYRKKQNAQRNHAWPPPENHNRSNAKGDLNGEATLSPIDLIQMPDAANGLTATPDEIATQVCEIYRAFGRKVQEVLGERVKFVESDHFFIWTDWPTPFQGRLVNSAEGMYAALCGVFGIDRTQHVFLAKCPLFCFESKARFLRFAQSFDGHDGRDAIGYTRSIERNGHVHVVLLRRGQSEADFERFEHTLVHEGTHAFLHRLYAPRLIPNWINEGVAEYMSDLVLGDGCPAWGNAVLLATNYVRHDWPVAPMLASAGPISVHQYPVAHSLVAHLVGMKAAPLSRVIKSLKSGKSFAETLDAEFDGITVSQFEQRWRQQVRQSFDGKD